MRPPPLRVWHLLILIVLAAAALVVYRECSPSARLIVQVAYARQDSAAPLQFSSGGPPDRRAGDGAPVFVEVRFEQPPRRGRRCRVEVTGRPLDANGVSAGRDFRTTLHPERSYVFEPQLTRSGRCHVEVRIDLLEHDIHFESEWRTSRTIRLPDFQALEP